MVHFEFGRYALAQAHPLKAFELDQRQIKASFEACLAAEQVIEMRCERNVLPKRFQLDPFGFHPGACSDARSLCRVYPDASTRQDAVPLDRGIREM